MYFIATKIIFKTFIHRKRRNKEGSRSDSECKKQKSGSKRAFSNREIEVNNFLKELIICEVYANRPQKNKNSTQSTSCLCSRTPREKKVQFIFSKKLNQIWRKKFSEAYVSIAKRLNFG